MSIKWTFMTTCTPSHTQHDWRSEFKRLEGAYAPATMKSYYADVSAFVAWCEANHQDPFPACVDTVCAFLEADAVEHVPNSVRCRLYAIRKIHQLLRLPDPTWDEEINLTFRRIRRRKTSRPKQAKGLTRDYLDRFLAAPPPHPPPPPPPPPRKTPPPKKGKGPPPRLRGFFWGGPPPSPRGFANRGVWGRSR